MIMRELLEKRGVDLSLFFEEDTETGAFRMNLPCLRAFREIVGIRWPDQYKTEYNFMRLAGMWFHWEEGKITSESNASDEEDNKWIEHSLNDLLEWMGE